MVKNGTAPSLSLFWQRTEILILFNGMILFIFFFIWLHIAPFLFLFPLDNHIPFHQNKMVNILAIMWNIISRYTHTLCSRKLLIHIILWHTWIPHTLGNLTRKKLYTRIYYGKCWTRKEKEKPCQNDDDDNTVCMNEKRKKKKKRRIMLYQLKQHNWCV